MRERVKENIKKKINFLFFDLLLNHKEGRRRKIGEVSDER